MEFLTQFKQTMQNTLGSGDIVTARTLMNGFHKTQTAYDGDIYYLEALLAYYEGRYALAKLWGRLCYERAPEHPLIQELLSYLTEGDTAFDEYEKPTFDPTFVNRKFRIIIVEGILPIIDYTAEQFRKGFEALGHETLVLDVSQFQTSSKDLLAFVKGGADFALTFNSVATALKTPDGDVFWEKFKIPCLNYLFDHPLYYVSDMDAMTDSMIVTCVDRNHVKWIERFHPNVKNCFYFPLGGELIPPRQVLAWEERPIDALYVGSLKRLNFTKNTILTKLVTSYLFANSNTTSEYAFELCLHALYNACKREGLNPLAIEDIPETIRVLDTDYVIKTDNAITDEMLKTIIHENRHIDMNVNAYYRKELVAVLVRNGIHVTVYGNGWDDPDLTCHEAFHYGGLIPQEECIQKMHESKIVLNSLPWFKDGTHDRIVNAMLCGAVCVTDKSIYLEEEYKDGENIVFYDLDQMDELPSIVRDLLHHPERASRIATAGFEKVALHHTWDERATELVTRFMTGDFT